MFTTEYKLTLFHGHSGIKSLCLPPGTYSPFACGGGWPYECGWVIEGRGISGGASSTCNPTSGSFTISSEGDMECCCDAKVDEVLSNQDVIMAEIDPSRSTFGKSSSSADHSSREHIAVDGVILVVGTVIFVGLLSSTVAVAFFNRQRYIALEDAYSGGQ